MYKIYTYTCASHINYVIQKTCMLIGIITYMGVCFRGEVIYSVLLRATSVPVDCPCSGSTHTALLPCHQTFTVVRPTSYN